MASDTKAEERRLDRESVRRLSRRSDAHGLGQLARHVGLLCVTAALVWASRGHWWFAAALLLYGIVLCFLFCALHESIHRTAFAAPWLNDTVAWVCGAILLLPPAYFRHFHFAHHRFTQDRRRDPELATPPPATLAQWLLCVSGVPYWHERLRTTLRHALTGRVREPCIPAAGARLIVREARTLWACYLCVSVISIYWRSGALLIYWVLPALLGQPFLRMFLLSEHTGCAFSDDMLANTRSTRSNAAVRFLSWQMPYHAEHHCFPAVPFHALADLNTRIAGRLQVRAPGYLAFHRELLRRIRGAGSVA